MREKKRGKKKHRYLFRCPDRLSGVLADQRAQTSPFLDELRRRKLSPYLAGVIDSKVPWDPRDGFRLEENPFASDTGTTPIVVSLDVGIYKEFRKYAAEVSTTMARLLIQWLIEEPEIAEALRKR